MTADGATGARTGELWYKPWGESRGTAFGATPTARRFTGQTLDSVAGGSGTFGSRRYEGWRSARSAQKLATARVFVGFVDLRDFVFQTPATRGATPQTDENGIFSIILGRGATLPRKHGSSPGRVDLAISS